MMTRDEIIKRMMEMAYAITGKNSNNYDWDKMCDIWTMCNNWNYEHEDEEIFMCDYQSEGSEYVNGFMIEDDYFIIED